MSEKEDAEVVGATEAGRALWRSVVDVYDLDEHERRLLVEIVRTTDLVERLEADIAEHGLVTSSPQGLKTSPSIVEIRQQRIVLARLMAALRLPSGETPGDDTEAARPQRRGAPRGTYAMKAKR